MGVGQLKKMYHKLTVKYRSEDNSFTEHGVLNWMRLFAESNLAVRGVIY